MTSLNTETIAPTKSRITTKSTYNAFLDTNLEELLKAQDIDTVVITGTLTNLCCETTARDAFCRNFEVVVVDDGCAAASERHHRAALENLEFGFADVWTIKQVLQELDEPSSHVAGQG